MYYNLVLITKKVDNNEYCLCINIKSSIFVNLEK